MPKTLDQFYRAGKQLQIGSMVGHPESGGFGIIEKVDQSKAYNDLAIVITVCWSHEPPKAVGKKVRIRDYFKVSLMEVDRLFDGDLYSFCHLTLGEWSEFQTKVSGHSVVQL